MFFVQVKGPQTVTGDGVERWHTVTHERERDRAMSAYHGWAGSSFCFDHDARLVKTAGTDNNTEDVILEEQYRREDSSHTGWDNHCE